MWHLLHVAGSLISTPYHLWPRLCGTEWSLDSMAQACLLEVRNEPLAACNLVSFRQAPDKLDADKCELLT